MKKEHKETEDELREEYKASDFSGGLKRCKYAKRMQTASNIVVLKPEVADVFPNEEAVNNALMALIDIAHRTAQTKKR